MSPTEVILSVLRCAIADIPGVPSVPKILLTTAPGELHTLVFLMLEAALSRGRGLHIRRRKLPLQEIAGITQAHGIEIVTLYFSIGFPGRKMTLFLTRLREELDDAVEIGWEEARFHYSKKCRRA